MYTLRVPFRLAEGKALVRLEELVELECDPLQLRMELECRPPEYALVVRGFESEGHAEDFLPRLFTGLFWAMLGESVPFRAEEELCDVYYPEDPKAAGTNIFGKDAGVSVDGIIHGDSPAVYPSKLRISVAIAGEARIEVGISAPSVLSSIHEGLVRVREDALQDGRLRIALELYRAHFFERSSEAKLLTLVTALETLAPRTCKHPIALELLERWLPQLQECRNGLDPQSEAYFALSALERELFSRRETSLRSRVRMLVQSTCVGAGLEDPKVRANRAVKVYDIRSTLVHSGRVDPRELSDALRDAKDLVSDILRTRMLAE